MSDHVTVTDEALAETKALVDRYTAVVRGAGPPSEYVEVIVKMREMKHDLVMSTLMSRMLAEEIPGALMAGELRLVLNLMWKVSHLMEFPQGEWVETVIAFLMSRSRSGAVAARLAELRAQAASAPPAETGLPPVEKAD